MILTYNIQLYRVSAGFGTDRVLDGAGVTSTVVPCDWLEVEVGILADHMGLRADVLPITVEGVSNDILATGITMERHIGATNEIIGSAITTEDRSIENSWNIKKGIYSICNHSLNNSVIAKYQNVILTRYL